MTKAWIGIADGALELAHLEGTLLELADRLELPVVRATSHLVEARGRQVAGVLSVASLRVDIPFMLAAWSRDHRAAALIDDGVSVFASGQHPARVAAADAVAHCKRGVEGRAIRFAGQDEIPDTVAVDRLVAETAIASPPPARRSSAPTTWTSRARPRST